MTGGDAESHFPTNVCSLRQVCSSATRRHALQGAKGMTPIHLQGNAWRLMKLAGIITASATNWSAIINDAIITM